MEAAVRIGGVFTPEVVTEPLVIRVVPEFARPAPQLAAPSAPDAASTHINVKRNAQLTELLQLAAQGHLPAFEAFYRATIRLAGGVARPIVGPNHLEDVLSDAYFQVWRQAGAFDAERSGALTWLLTLVRSRALDRLRIERSRHGGLSGAPDMPDSEGDISPSPGPDMLLDAARNKNSLHNAITELSPSERLVVTLAYFGDLSHAQIAAVTTFPLGTVKTLIRKAQQKIVRCMERTHRRPGPTACPGDCSPN